MRLGVFCGKPRPIIRKLLCHVALNREDGAFRFALIEAAFSSSVWFVKKSFSSLHNS